MRRKIFVNREHELNMLGNIWEKEKFSFVIIYGRRRVGKTRLLTKFAEGKKHIYYAAVEAPYEFLCNDFSNVVKEFVGLPISGDIIEVIESIPRLVKEKVLIIIDEFQYIVESDKSFMSRLQRAVDSTLFDKNMMIVVCGSSVSFFEKELLGYKSPLFGRRTASHKLKELGFKDIKGFFPEYGITDLITVYGMVGGTPAYLEKLDPKIGALENVYNIITPGTYLYDEALNLLRQEVREPRTYLSILASIAEGKDTIGEVASIAKIDPRSITKYILLLEELDIIERMRPLGYKRPVKLRIRDNYFRFWFTYNYKLRSLLESLRIDIAYKHIESTFNEYLSKVFEDLILNLVFDLYAHKVIITRPVNIGRWWYKDQEIDCVVRDPGRSTTFIEVKWSDLNISDGERLLKELEKKASKSGLTSPSNYYLLVTRKISNAESPVEIDAYHKIVDLRTIEKAISKAMK